MLIFTLAFCGGVLGVSPLVVYAQEQGVITEAPQEYIARARVLSASPSEEKTELWSGRSSLSQTVTVRILSGSEAGLEATFTNDFTQVKMGDQVYVRHTIDPGLAEFWAITDSYRLPVLTTLLLGFLALLFLFGGIQGLRGLASLLGSLVLIFYVLIPGIDRGFSPIAVSIGVASLIIIAGSYITHGFTRTTTAAMLGMIVTVLCTGAITYVAVIASHLSGFIGEESVYLDIHMKGTIDLVGLFFGSVMIGLLGILYDVAIGQAIAVEELSHAGVHYSRTQVFRRAIRIGREHIGALVNTLAIAYVGAALPLLLLLYSAETGILYLLNSERFAAEIIRILAGSAGVVLAVPITTFVGVYFLYNASGQRWRT